MKINKIKMNKIKLQRKETFFLNLKILNTPYQRYHCIGNCDFLFKISFVVSQCSSKFIYRDDIIAEYCLAVIPIS